MTNRTEWAERVRYAAKLVAFMATMTAARSSLANHYQVPSGSMQPTIEVGDRVLVNQLAYGLRLPFSDIELLKRGAPARGEVAILRSPVEDITLIKRVVAVPGDEVTIRAGRIWIDGAAVPRTHEISLERGGGPDFGPVRLGPDEYLVVGDNRGNSRDGREFGTVKRENFLGRAIGVYWRGSRPVWRSL